MVESIIKGILENFCVVTLVVSLIIAFILHYFRKRKISLVEEIFRWCVALGYGAAAIYSFVCHVFFQSVSAKTIGWQPSPFEYEVAIANLAIGVLGILSFKASYNFRLAAVIGITCWLWGDAVGHIYQMAIAHNLSAGNAGVWFWCDLLVPAILISLLVIMKRIKLGQE